MRMEFGDVEEFVTKNKLSKRTEEKLRQLSTKDQKFVMGVDGGRHSKNRNTVKSALKGARNSAVCDEKFDGRICQ